MKSCPLRKNCEWCLEPYGRKIQKSTRGYKSYQAVRCFEESKYCSKECRDQAERQRRKEAAEEREAKQVAQAKILRDAYNQFCYPGVEVLAIADPLTKSQQHIYNMKVRGYPVESIAERMNKTIQSIRTALNEIKHKGWAV